jgi:hypothetical protein
VLIVAPEAGCGVDRAADTPKPQGLHHEAFDDVRVAGFLKARPLLAQSLLAKEKGRQTHATLRKFVMDIAQPLIFVQTIALRFVAEKYDRRTALGFRQIAQPLVQSPSLPGIASNDGLNRLKSATIVGARCRTSLTMTSATC